MRIFVCVPKMGKEEHEINEHREKMRKMFREDIEIVYDGCNAEYKKALSMAGVHPDEYEKRIPIIRMSVACDVLSKSDKVALGNGWENDKICVAIKRIAEENGVDVRDEGGNYSL